MSMLKRAFALTCLATATAAMAQSGSGWHGIGQAVAPTDAAVVTIAATPAGQSETRNREIMFCVEGHIMRLNAATLHFQGGGTQSIRISERVADGGCSRGKPLSSHGHGLESAEVAYDQAMLAGGTARVQLFVR